MALSSVMSRASMMRPTVQARPASRCTPISSRRRTVQVKALFGGAGGAPGGGNPFDMGKLMESVKKAQSMVQTETAKVQQDLASQEFEGYDPDETVKVVLSGNQEPRSVDVSDEAMLLGQEELSKRLTLAMKDAHTKSLAGMREKMTELAARLGVPNMPGGLPGM